MDKLFSPKQVARAIQVSESSVKRWCDKGDLEVHYTAGGHRKIPISSLIDFLRKTGQELLQPELLGLPRLSRQTPDDYQEATRLLTQALLHGLELQARQLVLELYLAEHSLANIFDKVIAPTMERIGQEWECGDAQVYQERRGCEIILQTLRELRSLLPIPAPHSPVAVGGTISGDHYRIPTAMVEMVLREHHWNACSLGDNLPIQTLERAILEYRPRLFWLSCSHLENPELFLEQYDGLYEQFGLSVAFVVGGRALTEPLRARMRYAVHCDTMQHLVGFLHSLQTADPSLRS